MTDGVAALVPGPALAGELAEVADRLVRVTVRVRPSVPGTGSGVIWRSDGLIVTNAHVARGRTALVDLWDGRRFRARVTARDPALDLAALRVDAADLPAANIVEAGSLRPGEIALAAGYPFGGMGALSIGMIHSVDNHRASRTPRWIRTDLSLAPGYSGGPLANAGGQVVGINAMIARGLGVAAPSSLVGRFLRRPTRRAPLGILVRPVGLLRDGEPRRGFLVLETDQDGAAARAGVSVGDVLTGIAGKVFEGSRDLMESLSDAEPGETLHVELLRGGRVTTVKVSLGSGPAEPQAV